MSQKKYFEKCLQKFYFVEILICFYGSFVNVEERAEHYIWHPVYTFNVIMPSLLLGLTTIHGRLIYRVYKNNIPLKNYNVCNFTILIMIIDVNYATNWHWRDKSNHIVGFNLSIKNGKYNRFKLFLSHLNYIKTPCNYLAILDLDICQLFGFLK